MAKREKIKQRWASFTTEERDVIEDIGQPWVPQGFTMLRKEEDGTLWGLADEVRAYRSQNTSGADHG
jgi:hypothetical protein